MDPLSESIKVFQKDLQKFRQNTEIKILCIVSSAEHTGTLAKVIRSEEWQQDNKSPFLISQAAYLKDPVDTADQLCRYIREHYSMIKKDFAKNKIQIPDLNVRQHKADVPIDAVVEHIIAFDFCLQDYCKPAVFCWMPSIVKKLNEWQNAINWFSDFLPERGNRLILASEKEKNFDKIIKNSSTHIGLIQYSYDHESGKKYFSALFASPSKGHIPGTPTGSAAPDVEPPLRKNPEFPVNDQTKSTIDNLKLPSFLTPQQSQDLNSLVIAAAQASGRKEENSTIEKQLAACKICEDAGVFLEHSLMRLTLANYFLQFKKMEDAIEQFRIAEELAVKIKAYPQLAQIRMAIAFVYMRRKRTRDLAIHEYEQAAAAAVIGDSMLLYVESLRMAGICYLKNKDTESAILCWEAAIVKCRKMSKEEIRGSTLLDISGKLIELLEDNNMFAQAEHIKQIVGEAGKQFDA